MSHPSQHLKSLILSNAGEITRLKSRIDETCALRDRSAEKRREWQRACEIFHSGYNELAFPGGYDGALDRLLAGDPDTVEAALCFLELRPYFFRSGYMFQEILRKAKRAPLNPEQQARLQSVVQALAVWRASKSAANALPRSSSMRCDGENQQGQDSQE